MPETAAEPQKGRAPIDFAGATDAGRVRTVNQDSHFVGELGGRKVAAIVADGMGGHRTGEVASEKAVQILRSELERGRSHPPVTLARALQTANLAIYDYAAEHPESSGMGTTCTVVVLDDQVGLVAHVGDSRAYLLREGELRQLTLDHTWVADRVRQGILSEEEAKQHRWRNVITNVLGSHPEIRVELLHFEVRQGDRILLCSDGISMLLSPEVMKRILSDADPAKASQELVDEANKRGSPDNITAVVLRANAVESHPKRYALPQRSAFEGKTVALGETMSGIREIEDEYPSQGFFSKLRRQPWYPYRFWLLGCLYLVLLIVLFSLWSR